MMKTTCCPAVCFLPLLLPPDGGRCCATSGGSGFPERKSQMGRRHQIPKADYQPQHSHTHRWDYTLVHKSLEQLVHGRQTLKTLDHNLKAKTQPLPPCAIQLKKQNKTFQAEEKADRRSTVDFVVNVYQLSSISRLAAAYKHHNMWHLTLYKHRSGKYIINHQINK